MFGSAPVNRRLRASAIHFAISALVASMVSLWVFLIWYPSPYASIAGGLGLFALLVSVDVVLGPALTAVAASPDKPLGELRRDLTVIVLVQLAAFAYGLYTIALARPVYLAFEVDRFRVVTAADIEPQLLKEAPPSLQTLPWFGPGLVAAVKPSDPAEQMRAIELGVSGIDLSMVPRNWRDYASRQNEAWQRARPIADLIKKYSDARERIAKLAVVGRTAPDSLRFLPLVSRQASWVTVIAAPEARIVGHLPYDGFF